MGLFDDVLAPGKKRESLFADVLKDPGSKVGREILAQADALGLGKRPVLGSSVPVIRTPGQFAPPEESAIERDRRRAREMAGSVFAEDVPARTLGEVAGDLYDRFRIGVRSVAGGLVELANTPQHAINLVNTAANGYAQMLGAQARIPMLPSYDWVRGTQAVLDEESKAIREQMTPAAIRQGAEFEAVDGVLPTLGYLATNPGEAMGQLAEQVPQFLAAGLPGGVPVKLAGAGAFAGGQTGAQVGAENQARVARGEITQAQADALTAQGVAGSAIVNSILPKIIPGGTVLEDALAGNKTGLTRGRGAALGLLGEGLTGGVEEAADQGLQNEATGKPLGEGVGKAFALGSLLEGPVGAVAGAWSAGKPRTLGEIPPEELGAAARAAAPKADAPQTSAIDPAILAAGNEALARAAKSAPPATAPRGPTVAPEPSDEIDALLARNLPPVDDALPPTAPAPANPSIEGAGVAATPEIDWQAAADALGLPTPSAQNPAASTAQPAEPAAKPVSDDARWRRPTNGQANPVKGGGLAGAMPAATGATAAASVQAGGDQAGAVDAPTMQNRDRSRAASVAQMQEIRKNPDPERLSFSRDPNTGAPMVGAGKDIPQADKGRTDIVVMASGRRVPVQYAVVEADDLAASHDADGRTNPDYDAAPLKALNNGRTAGLQAAYAAGNADAYRQGIAADAALHGVSAEAITSKRKPVLVRLYDPAQNTGDMGAESNATQQLGLSPVEQAQTDARAFPDLSGIVWNEDGSISPSRNADFFRGWFANMGKTQAASLQDAQGRPNAAALQRARAAMAYRAYGDERLLTALAEEIDPDNRNVLNALVQAAPGFAKLDDTQFNRDVKATLVGGLEVLRDARARGLNIDEALAQQDMLGRNPDADAVAAFMAANARSAKRMAEAFKAMAEYAARAESQAATLDVFGSAPQPTVSGALGDAGITENRYGIETGRDGLAVAEGTGGGQQAEGGRAAAGDAFTLTQQRAPAEQAAAPEEVGLFAPPTAQERNRAAQQQKDASRNGLGRDVVRPEQGDGELLAGGRPAQARVDEANESRQRGEEAADLLEIRDAVDRVVGPGRVIYLSDHTGLPDRLRKGVESRMAKRGGKGRTAALYDPQTKQVYLFTDVVTDPKRAVWHVMHEIAGHHGLREFLGDKLAPALEIALQNPTVKRVAEAIAKERNIDMASRSGRLLAAEEALAELAAAVRTGNFDAIASRYKVEVPEGIRASVAKAVENFVKRLKKLLDDMFGRPMFTDEDVRALLENAWQAARNGGEAAIGKPDALESTDDQTQSEAFKRWFGDSVVTENGKAGGKPLVVYHGTSLKNIAGILKNGLVPRKKKNHQESGDYVYVELSAKTARAWARQAGGTEFAVLEIEVPESQLVRDSQTLSRTSFRTERIPARLIKGWDVYRIDPRTGDLEYVRSESNPAFRPEQIKSATDNRGTFDPSNPSILESVEYTPEQEAALTKAGLQVDRRTSLQRTADSLREKWRSVRDTLRDAEAMKQAAFDRFHGLRHAEAQLGLNDPETSAYIAARMSAGLDAAMEAMLSFGAPVWDGGVLAIKDGTVGLLDALKPVEGMVDEWLGWMVGRRAKLLKSQGRENNLTDDDIAALLSLADGREQAFQQAARDYLKIKNAVLDVAEQAGLIDPSARAVWDHAEYIPFYRAEGDGSVGPGTRKGLQGQTSGIRTLKGGDQALADPLANIIRNFTKLVDASMKNRAVLLAVDNYGNQVFEKVGMDMAQALVPLDQVKKHLREQGTPESVINALPAGTLKGVQRMLSIVPPSAEDVVRVMRDGKAEYYRVKDPLVLRALTAFKQPNKSIAIKPFIWFKRLLTTGVTATPEFIVANFIRDSGSAWVISDDRFKPGWDSMRGVVNTLRNDQTTREMMMAGSTFLGGQFYDGNPDKAANAIRRALRSKGMSNRDIEGFIGTIASTPLKLWDGYLKLSGAVENANRRAVFDAAIKAGRTRTEAAYMARDLMDFAMQGDAAWVQLFSDILPFFNARLQGLYKLGRRAGTKQGRRAILLRGGVIALASVALYAWNLLAHSDGWDELEEWDKDAYWHVAPGTPYHIRIPKPFELGLLFGTAPERGMEAIRNRINQAEGDKPGTTLDALIRAITGTLAFNPVPQAALPIAEQWANKRFFTGRPIENMGDERLLPEDRKEWYTSDTMKALGRMSGISPKRLEHIWNGYTAGLGAYVLDASDAAVRYLEDAPERPDLNLSELPVLGRFARGGAPGRTKYGTQFYDRLRKAEQVEQSIKSRLEAGDKAGALKLERENAGLLGERIPSKRAKEGFLYAKPRAMRKVRGELSGIRDEIEAIATSRNMSAEEKRQQINALEERRNKMFRDAVKSAEQ